MLRTDDPIGDERAQRHVLLRWQRGDRVLWRDSFGGWRQGQIAAVRAGDGEATVVDWGRRTIHTISLYRLHRNYKREAND